MKLLRPDQILISLPLTQKEREAAKLLFFYALNATTGEEIWNCTTGNSIYPTPAVANGVVYIGIDNNVSALDADTGKNVWSYTTGDLVLFSPVVVN